MALFKIVGHLIAYRTDVGDYPNVNACMAHHKTVRVGCIVLLSKRSYGDSANLDGLVGGERAVQGAGLTSGRFWRFRVM